MDTRGHEIVWSCENDPHAACLDFERHDPKTVELYEVGGDAYHGKIVALCANQIEHAGQYYWQQLMPIN